MQEEYLVINVTNASGKRRARIKRMSDHHWLDDDYQRGYMPSWVRYATDGGVFRRRTAARLVRRLESEEKKNTWWRE